MAKRLLFAAIALTVAAAASAQERRVQELLERNFSTGARYCA